jgi:hypothetical protein
MSGTFLLAEGEKYWRKARNPAEGKKYWRISIKRAAEFKPAAPY